MKTFDEIIRTNVISISGFEQMRQEKLKERSEKSKKGALIGGGIFLLCCIIGIAFLPMFIVGVIAGLIVFFVIRGNIKVKLVKSFKEEVIKKLLEGVSPGFQYQPNQYINEVLFKKSQFLKGYSNYVGEDYFSGVYKEISFEFSELKVTQKNSKSTTTVFNGTFYVLKSPKLLSGRTTVVTDVAEKLFGGLGRALQTLNFGRDSLIRIQDQYFEQQFAVYSNNESEAQEIISSDLIQFLMDLKTQNSQVFFGFSEDNLYLGLYNTLDLFKVNIDNPVDENVLRNYYIELNSHLQIVEKLYLLVKNNRGFSRVINNNFM